MNDCRHLGGYRPDGSRFCAVHGSCDDALCSTCNDHQTYGDRGRCVFRGLEILREDENTVCGARGQMAALYRCGLLNVECSVVRYCHAQKARTCLVCDVHQEQL